MASKTTSPKDHFANLTPGKLTGLRQITDESGRFRVLAMDQSNSFKKALRAAAEKAGKTAEPTGKVEARGAAAGGKVEPGYEEIRDCKLEMTAAISGLASALLLDVNYGARQALNTVLPRNVGLIVRVEASRDAGTPGEYEPGWSVEKIKKMGGAAVKLLVYMDVTDKAYTKAQLAFAEDVHKACREQDILLMTEELSFPRQGEDKASADYQDRKIKNILESTELLGPITDILKLEFPGNIKADSEAKMVENLGKVDAAAIRPWVILSAGEKFDLFQRQVELALKAGCNGYMAGRAIFNEYFEQPTPAERAKFLSTTASDRMKKLNDLVSRHGKSWQARCGLTPKDLGAAVKPDWYLEGEKAKSPAKTAAVQGAY